MRKEIETRLFHLSFKYQGGISMKKTTTTITMTATEFINGEEYVKYQKTDDENIKDLTYSRRANRYVIYYDRPERKIIITDDGSICGKIMETIYKEWCIEQKYRRW